MTTTKTLTAAEARRIADELAAAEKDLTDRKRKARNAAQAAACREEFDRADREVIPAANAALARWNEVSSSDGATIGELWEAWTAVRVASAERAAVVAAANRTLGMLEPLRNEISGQPQEHRFDTHDIMASASFVDALDAISRARGERAGARALHATQQTIVAAGEAAAEEVK